MRGRHQQVAQAAAPGCDHVGEKEERRADQGRVQGLVARLPYGQDVSEPSSR